MKIVVWIAEGTWPACAAAASRVPAGADVELLHVADDGLAAAARGAFIGLLGRGQPRRDPAKRVEALSDDAADDVLAAAATGIGRPVTRVKRHGQVEREVVLAAAGADLLICARDGDRTRLGPHSLGPVTRFVVDHAPCPVLLLWPDLPPGVESIPPPPRPIPPR